MTVTSVLSFIFVTFPKLLDMFRTAIAVADQQIANAKERREHKEIDRETQDMHSEDRRRRLEATRSSEDRINKGHP